MSKQKLLNNLRNVYCRLQPSANHGVGVFAIRRIPKGINPFEVPIPTELISLTDDDIRTLPPGVRLMIRQYAVKENRSYVLSSHGFNLLELEYFVNHSAEANLSFDEDKGCYRTARPISPGEELTGDYNHYAPNHPPVKKSSRSHRDIRLAVPGKIGKPYRSQPGTE